MNRRLPPTVALAACLAVVVVVALPYLVLPETETSGLGVYYDAGLLGPVAVATFALVGAVVFAAGRKERTPPETAAGAGLVVGVVVFLVSLQWALAVDQTVLQQISTAAWLTYHRWVLVAVSALVPLCGAWYARSLSLI